MRLRIIGKGSFGTFLKELLDPDFVLVGEEDDQTVCSTVLAVPISAYREVGLDHDACHLINVCSVQQPSTLTLLKLTPYVTSVHPLFGQRNPVDKRFHVVTHRCGLENETEFLKVLNGISKCLPDMSPAEHDQIMAKTHYEALLAARLLGPVVENAKDIPDELVPNSFRLLRQFVKTVEDMPTGTVESIMANPYIPILDDRDENYPDLL